MESNTEHYAPPGTNTGAVCVICFLACTRGCPPNTTAPSCGRFSLAAASPRPRAPRPRARRLLASTAGAPPEPAPAPAPAPAPPAAAAAATASLSTRTTYSDEQVANRNDRDFGWEISLTRPLRDAHRFPSTRWYPVPGATRTTLGFGIRPSFKDPFLSRRAKPLQSLSHLVVLGVLRHGQRGELVRVAPHIAYYSSPRSAR